MVYNVVLYIICGLVMGSWILPLYSIVTYGAALKTIDYIVEGIDRSKAATIITGCPEEVCKVLSDTFSCGITIIPVSYTHLCVLFCLDFFTGKSLFLIFTPCFLLSDFFLSTAHAAGAHPFSGGRERMQRERKGGNRVFPL